MSALFNYTARSMGGEFVAGALHAENREQALAHLRTRSLFVTSLGRAETPGGVLASLFTALPVSAAARNTVVRSLATLTRAGVPLKRALAIVTEGCRDARLREALNSIASDIDSGIALSAAIEKRPREFSGLFVALIRAGELAGSVDAVLDRIATFLERDTAARKRLRSALAYPAVVTCAALGLVVFLVSNTVPAFAQLFAQMHVALPLTTRVLIALGNGLKSPAFYAALLIVGLSAAIVLLWLRGSSRGAQALEDFAHRLPVLGPILRKSLLARFSRTLGTLLRSGVPLLGALEASREVMASASYANAAAGIAEALRQGAPVSQALKQAALYDALVLALVQVGEETGSLDEMLIRVAEYYELDVETAVTSLAAILEPLIIVVLGVVVGTIVGSILLPLYSMIGSIK